ncbi:MAG: hypothetical protein ACI9WU_003990 [Myxococcota bacterium]
MAVGRDPPSAHGDAGQPAQLLMGVLGVAMFAGLGETQPALGYGLAGLCFVGWLVLTVRASNTEDDLSDALVERRVGPWEGVEVDVSQTAATFGVTGRVRAALIRSAGDPNVQLDSAQVVYRLDPVTPVRGLDAVDSAIETARRMNAAPHTASLRQLSSEPLERLKVRLAVYLGASEVLRDLARGVLATSTRLSASTRAAAFEGLAALDDFDESAVVRWWLEENDQAALGQIAALLGRRGGARWAEALHGDGRQVDTSGAVAAIAARLGDAAVGAVSVVAAEGGGLELLEAGGVSLVEEV